MNPLGLLRALPFIVLQAIHDSIAYGPLDTPEAQAALIARAETEASWQ